MVSLARLSKHPSYLNERSNTAQSSHVSKFLSFSYFRLSPSTSVLCHDEPVSPFCGRYSRLTYCFLEQHRSFWIVKQQIKLFLCRLPLKCDGTRAETRFRLAAKRTSQIKSAGASVQSTTGSGGVRISGSNAGYTIFRVVWRVLATHSIRQFLLHFPSRASPCAITFQLDSAPWRCIGALSVWLRIMELITQLEVIGRLRIAVALSPVHTRSWVDLICSWGFVNEKFLAFQVLNNDASVVVPVAWSLPTVRCRLHFVTTDLVKYVSVHLFL
jgi:hypothetical protein